MSIIEINFYDEIVELHNILNFAALKSGISSKYSMEKSDVDELIIFALIDGEKISLSNESDYQLVKKAPQKLKIFLEVCPKSQLYQKEFQASKIVLEKPKIELSTVEKLRKEIEEKERQLKEIELREELKKKKKSLEDSLLQQQTKLFINSIPPLTVHSSKVSYEESITSETLQQLIEKNISEAVEKKFEEIKKSIIETSAKEATKAVELSLSKIDKVNESVHYVKCNYCHVSPIKGNRFKCVVCLNYNLCQHCEEAVGDNHPHNLLKIKKPENKIDKLDINPFGFQDINAFQPKPKTLDIKIPHNDLFWVNKKLNEIKGQYNLKFVPNEKIKLAIFKANGNLDQAIALLSLEKD